MKVTGNYLCLFCWCLCLVASRNLVHSKTFKTYAKAKSHFQQKKYLDGHYAFARGKDSDVDSNTFHDVMATLFLSEFVYCLGALRRETKKLSFSKSELKNNVLDSSVFRNDNEKNSMIELLTGNKINRGAGKAAPAIRMAQIEHVLSHNDYYETANERFATELTAAAMHAFSGKNLPLRRQVQQQEPRLLYCRKKSSQRRTE